MGGGGVPLRGKGILDDSEAVAKVYLGQHFTTIFPNFSFCSISTVSPRRLGERDDTVHVWADLARRDAGQHGVREGHFRRSLFVQGAAAQHGAESLKGRRRPHSGVKGPMGGAVAKFMLMLDGES